jgi:hypothetical protein
MPIPPTHIIERILPKIATVDGEGCWLWTGKSVDGHGYPTVGVGGRGDGKVQVHKFLWEFCHGPTPEGLELDHLCRNILCVRPSHLEPVTHQENILRSPLVRNRFAVVCGKGGHAMTGDNVVHTKQGKKYCRACRRIKARAAQKRYREKKAAAVH